MWKYGLYLVIPRNMGYTWLYLVIPNITWVIPGWKIDGENEALDFLGAHLFSGILLLVIRAYVMRPEMTSKDMTNSVRSWSDNDFQVFDMFWGFGNNWKLLIYQLFANWNYFPYFGDFRDGHPNVKYINLWIRQQKGRIRQQNPVENCHGFMGTVGILG